jgi:hypothetical protein
MYPANRVPLYISLKSRQGAGRAPTCCHVPCSTEPYPPVKVGSGATTCPVAPDPASMIGRAPTPPRVPWLRIPHPYKGGLRCATCPTAPDPVSLQGRAPVTRSFDHRLRSDSEEKGLRQKTPNERACNTPCYEKLNQVN